MLPHTNTCYHLLLQLLCGLQVYVKFAGSVVIMLRRWLDSEEIPSDDELTKNEYFSNIHQRISDKPSSRDQRMVMLDEAELRKKTSLLGPSAGDKYKGVCESVCACVCVCVSTPPFPFHL